MSIDLDFLLENRETLLFWDDAWSGHDGRREVTTNVQQSATVEDCIRMQRLKSILCETFHSSRVLLDQFTVTNWVYMEAKDDN